MFSKNRQRKLPKFKLCVSKKSINTGFVWLGKVRMKTAIFDLIREIQGMSGKFVNLSGIFFVGEILSLFCILVSFNPNIIVLCNHHFANHENIVLWLYYQHGYQFLNCSEFFFFCYLKYTWKSHFFRLILKLFWILIFWQNLVSTKSGKPKKIKGKLSVFLQPGKSLQQPQQ